MISAAAYSALRSLGQPVIRTGEAATLLSLSPSSTTRALRHLEAAGLLRRVRSGLWALDFDVAPAVLAPYLTWPYPAYISFWSAMAHHEMIEQIPARVEVASLARSQTVSTSYGTFAIHRLSPAVFSGFEGHPQAGYWATPEKALFDTMYVLAPKGGPAPRLPELHLPGDFNRQLLDGWIEEVPTSRPPARRLRAADHRRVCHHPDEVLAALPLAREWPVAERNPRRPEAGLVQAPGRTLYSWGCPTVGRATRCSRCGAGWRSTSMW